MCITSCAVDPFHLFEGTSSVNKIVHATKDVDAWVEWLPRFLLIGFLSTTCFIGSKNQDKSSEYRDFGVLRWRDLNWNNYYDVSDDYDAYYFKTFSPIYYRGSN